MAAAEIEIKILIAIDVETKDYKWQIVRRIKDSEDPWVIFFTRFLSKLIDEQDAFLSSIASSLATYQMKEVENEFVSNDATIAADLDFLKKKSH